MFFSNPYHILSKFLSDPPSLSFPLFYPILRHYPFLFLIQSSVIIPNLFFSNPPSLSLSFSYPIIRHYPFLFLSNPPSLSLSFSYPILRHYPLLFLIQFYVIIPFSFLSNPPPLSLTFSYPISTFPFLFPHPFLISIFHTLSLSITCWEPYHNTSNF